MNLIDSSIWIYYYRPMGPRKLQEITKEFIHDDSVALNGIIMVEVLSGISIEGDFKKVESDFEGFHMLDLNIKVFREASSIGTSLRKIGLTVPATDLIIAATAIHNNCTLYHLDTHFDLVAKHTRLNAKNLGKLLD